MSNFKIDEQLMLGFGSGLEGNPSETVVLFTCSNLKLAYEEGQNHDKCTIKTMSLSYHGVNARMRKHKIVKLFDKEKYTDLEDAQEGGEVLVIKYVPHLKATKNKS